MKKIIVSLLILCCLALQGCESATAFGPCVGITDDKDPNLIYKPSILNIVLGILFIEVIVPPVVVVVNEFSCPVGRK